MERVSFHSEVACDATSQDEPVGSVHPQAVDVDQLFDGDLQSLSEGPSIRLPT